jgi:hypothetical protein
MLEFGTAMGVRVSGDVARTDDPVDAARGAANGFDEMIVIDNPRDLARWRSETALADLAADPGLPLHHFRADPPMTLGKQFDTAELRVHLQRFLADLKRSGQRSSLYARRSVMGPASRYFSCQAVQMSSLHSCGQTQ